MRAVDLAIPMDQLAMARPEEPAVDLYTRMGEMRTGWALVFDADRLVGLVAMAAIIEAIRRGKGSSRRGGGVRGRGRGTPVPA